MAKYSYITDKTHNNRKIQVESAKRDGSGKNIENNYAKQNGNYQSFTAGLSNNFDTKLVMVDESAYNFRPTASIGSRQLEVGSPCKVKKIVGGSVAFNQVVKNGNFVNDSAWYLTGITTTSVFSVSNNVAHIEYGSQYTMGGLVQGSAHLEPYKIGHKYFSCATIKNNDTENARGFNLGQAYGNGVKNRVVNAGETRTIEGIFAITQNTGSGYDSYLISGNQVNIIYDFDVKNVQLIDLTQMFGSTIADYIYSLEQANSGSGVAWFKRYFPKEYYAYNSGELVSVKTQGKKITHFNQWDEETIVGTFYSNGSFNDEASEIASKNFIRVIGGTTYYIKGSAIICEYNAEQEFIRTIYMGNETFTTSSNCSYIKFGTTNTYGTTYNHDICINFHYDGERDGEYEPYNSETYACDDDELRGIPQLDENNNLVFNGDEYLADGTKNVRYGIVDLSTLSFESIGNNVYLATISDLKAPSNNGVAIVGISSKYAVVSYNALIVDTTSPQICGYVGTNRVYVRDTSGTPSGYLIYELETPTTDSLTPFTEVQECDNWGTEEWLAPTTDTRPCEVPVGHETDYLPDLKAKVEVAPSTPNENGVYVMEHSESGNSYTPIATWLTNNGYAKADTLPTKDSVGGTLRQLLSVKETLDFDNTAYIDLGSLNWSYYDVGNYFYATIDNKKTPAGTSSSNTIISTKYQNGGTYYADGMTTDKRIYESVNKNIYIKDSSFGTDTTAFKNAMKGVLLAFEKAS